MTDRRLIEAAFPLKQASLDSVHEKNVRHGHISTLHIWPARRPLAASRAALLATLLPDPGTAEGRREVLRRMAGTVVETPDAKGERMREETRGGILHWGREGALDTGGGAGVGVEAFREQIRQAFGGRVPRVLDPFAGGGAIPLEAMRLGCEAVASDLNPVAWFILRCTLHYPHLLAGQRRPLPEFALRDRAFATAFLKGQGVKRRKALRQCLAALGHGEDGFGNDQDPAHEGMQTLLALGRGAGNRGADRSAPDATHQTPSALGRSDGNLDVGRLALKAGGQDSSALVRGDWSLGVGRPAAEAGGTGQAPSALGRSDGAAHPSADALDAPVPVEADFAWHLRAWGQRILERARRALAARYPTYAEFEPVRRKGRRAAAVRLERRYRPRPRQLLAADDAGRVSTAALNAEFDSLYLEDEANPRWVAKPAVAYLWARTVRCAGCRKEVPLLKTRWLCRKGAKRVLLTMRPGEDGVAFGVAEDAPAGGAGERRQSDQQLGAGTMSKSGATCPCCGVIATMADLRAAGRAGQLGARLTAVVVEGQQGKEYRLPTDEEVDAARIEEEALANLYAELPLGLPEEPTPKAGIGASRAFSIDGYGFDAWRKLFTNRQLLALGTFIRELRSLWAELDEASTQHWSASAPLSASGAQIETETMGADESSLPAASPQCARSSVAVDRLDSYPNERREAPEDREGGAAPGHRMDGYPQEWREAIAAYLACVLSKLADYSSAVCSWHNSGEKLRDTFARFALPMVWDYCEVNPLSDTSGGFIAMLNWVARYVDHALAATAFTPAPKVQLGSACAADATEDWCGAEQIDLICTDPPYYDAIPYSDLMDFFHVWLRRALHGLSPETDAAFAEPLGPKWSAAANDGELIDDAARFGGDRAASKRNYEDGMARSFARFHEALREDGRLVIVFANKQPDAWETLVSALIRAGFVVVGSWPIQTEMQNRQRSLSSAALSSSIWLVCRKRPAAARPGWDRQVLAEMQANIRQRLRDFWDAGIRGPDFVWAATGPALEAFSRHPLVKFTDAPGERLTVAEFLRQVRRMVVGFVVSRLFEAGGGAMQELDDPTTYYLLHRNDFGLAAAPAGACILYALSCNLSDADLSGRLDLLVKGGGAATKDDGEDGEDDEDASGQASGSEARLKPWNRRRAKGLGEPAADGGPPPLIDCLHRLMRLWKTGEQSRVDAYLESRGLWRHELFARVVQALIELAETGADERATLEYIQNHLAAQGAAAAPQQETIL